MSRWLAVMLLFSGCAFGLSGPDPDRPRSQEPKCDTSKGLVVLDGVVAATAGIIAASVAGDSDPAVSLLPLSIGALYAAGAIRGNSNVNKCRAAMAEYESYTAARETLRPPQAPVDELDSERPPPEREPIASRGSPPPVPVQPTAPVAPATPAPIAATAPAPAPAPVIAPAPAATPAAPAPAPAAPVAKPGKPAKQPPAAKQEPGDDWSDFWREVQ